MIWFALQTKWLASIWNATLGWNLLRILDAAVNRFSYKNSSDKFAGEHPCCILFLIKLQAYSLQVCFIKILEHMFFPVDFANFGSCRISPGNLWTSKVFLWLPTCKEKLKSISFLRVRSQERQNELKPVWDFISVENLFTCVPMNWSEMKLKTVWVSYRSFWHKWNFISGDKVSCKNYPKWNAYTCPSKYRIVLKCSRNETSFEQNLFSRRFEIPNQYELISPRMWTNSKVLEKYFTKVYI